MLWYLSPMAGTSRRRAQVDLDETDRAILRILQGNGRITNAALAEAVGLTATPMLARIKKLEQSGTIQRYTAVIDRFALVRSTMALVMVKLAEHRLPEERVEPYTLLVGMRTWLFAAEASATKRLLVSFEVLNCIGRNA